MQLKGLFIYKHEAMKRNHCDFKSINSDRPDFCKQLNERDLMIQHPVSIIKSLENLCQDRKYMKWQTYQNATNMSVKVSIAEKAANTIQYIIHLTWK